MEQRQGGNSDPSLNIAFSTLDPSVLLPRYSSPRDSDALPAAIKVTYSNTLLIPFHKNFQILPHLPLPSAHAIPLRRRPSGSVRCQG